MTGQHIIAVAIKNEWLSSLVGGEKGKGLLKGRVLFEEVAY